MQNPWRIVGQYLLSRFWSKYFLLDGDHQQQVANLDRQLDNSPAVLAINPTSGQRATLGLLEDEPCSIILDPVLLRGDRLLNLGDGEEHGGLLQQVSPIT